MCIMLALLITTSAGLAAAKKTGVKPEPYVQARILTFEAANRVAVAAARQCQGLGHQVAVAVVDRYGNLLAFARDPFAGAHTITIAEYKAYTAATFQGATIELPERLQFLKGTPKLSLVGGGVPIQVGGYMYGAVGVSGAPRRSKPGDVDHLCAVAGVSAIQEELEFAS